MPRGVYPRKILSLEERRANNAAKSRAYRAKNKYNPHFIAKRKSYAKKLKDSGYHEREDVKKRRRELENKRWPRRAQKESVRRSADRKKNREKYRAWDKKHYALNKEKILARGKQFRESKRGREWRRAYNREHWAQELLRILNYIDKHPEVVGRHRFLTRVYKWAHSSTLNENAMRHALSAFGRESLTWGGSDESGDDPLSQILRDEARGEFWVKDEEYFAKDFFDSLHKRQIQP